MSKISKILIPAVLALVLTLSLVAVACAPKAPAGDVVPKEQLTKAQADLAAEKQKAATAEKKAKDLEAQLAAAQKPAKVYRWEPGTWQNQGCSWDYLTSMAEWLNTTTEGRIEMTPSACGAICPVEEQMEAAAAGTTQAMLPTPSYYPGKIPLAALYSTAIGLPTMLDMINCHLIFENGAAYKLYKGEVEKRYNVEVVAEHLFETDNIFSSGVNIPHVADLKGVKFRCGDEQFAVPLAVFGASTVWFPGTEIYTGLATGVIDAFTYGSAYDHLSLGAQEVSKYWGPRNYPFAVGCNAHFVVNGDVWKEMPEDLQKAVLEASDAAQYGQITKTSYLIDEAWKMAIAAGIIPVYWDANDSKAWAEQQMIWAKKYTDQYPECAEFMKIVIDYRAFKGF